ncbi:MAG: IS91 family transposase [Myxococcales bacterium]|nr:IS91 family transposase [Myxococcales bacterium]
MSPPSPGLGDVIDRFEAPLRLQRGAAMTSAQSAVLSALSRCRTAALGGHLYRCERCGHEHPAYNGCRDRHCPSCLGGKSAAWLTARSSELLPLPYFHVVFTVPQQVAAVALGNKKVVYSILFRAAARTLQQIAADPRHLGAQLGFLAILHTWTQTLQHHPHIHCVVPGGGLAPDGSRWVRSREDFLLPVKVLSKLFAGKFLDLLTKAYERGELRFGGSTASLAQAHGFKQWVRRVRDKSWVVYSKPPFGSPQQVLKYLARYTHRVAISNARIVSVTDTEVAFRYRSRKAGNAMGTMRLAGEEFLRRFLLHVLPKGFVRIRHFGWMANRDRKAKLARCRALLGVTAAAASQETEAPNRRDIEQDPATSQPQPEPKRCPNCKLGLLRLVRSLPALMNTSLGSRVPRAPP